MRRRLLIFTLALLASVTAVVATIPLWLGVAVKFAARSHGVTFGSYERIGYSRFMLRDVEVRLPTVRVTATRAEADTPVVWLWRHAQKHPTGIVGGDWRVEVQPGTTTTPKKPSTEKGWVPLRALLQRIATQLDRWAPQVTAGAGVVTWPGSEISVRTVKWSGRELALDGVAYKTLKADATVAFAADDTLRVKARLADDTLRTSLVSRGSQVSGDFTLWDQPASLNANYAPRGWLPAEASIAAKEWKVPGERLKMGTVYSLVRGSAQIEWRAEHFVADINATSEPVPGKSAPPLELAVRGKGDMQAFTIESLNATLPGVTSRLTEPVTIERNGKIRESAAQFSLRADLSKMPWFSAAGAVTGEARLVSGFSASPSVEFSLDAQKVSAQDVALSAASARGRLDWPRLQISEGAIVGGEGERLTWHGGWNFQTKEILDAAIDGQLRRQSLARWLPKQPEFDIVTIRAGASGALAEVKHQGTASADGVKVNGVSPLALTAEWHGRGITVEEIKVQARAGASTIIAGGKLDATSLQLTTFDFNQADASRLKLANPATIRWRPQLQLDALRLAGREGEINASVTMGEKGRIEVAAKNFSSKWLSDFVATPGPAWTVTLLGLVGSWEKGPMTFSLTTGASLEIGEGRAAAVNISARGDKDGVRIEALRATEGDAAVINATGRLPVVFSPGGSPLMHMDPNGALVLDATVAPNADFWQKLATMSGVELKDPRASARLTGTWQQPQGSASLQAAGVTIDPKRVTRPLPAIQALDVQVTGDRSGVMLQKFSLEVEGQAVRASGRLPIPNGNWSELFKAPLATAQRGADLRLEIPDAEVAVFTRFLPAVLAPKGRLQLDVQYKGGELEGFMRLRDAASRPLGPLGVLQEISADIAVSGRKLALRGVTAKSGGQPITLNGIIELPEKGGPQFDLALRGENLPFVRQTGLLMRGDLDLKLQTPAGAQPRLSGNVRLRDSLFLSDVRSFLPKGGASASRRPPYFSIEAAPVNVWSLAVDVLGDRFLRLRTPVFTGVASARFRLGGTLGEPRAIGEITVDEGNIRMPFASFAVTQGSVRLTEADPYEPSIYLRGSGRRYGYDITMEIDGNASQPNVVFMSSPPLDSEQVLLMVMTGSAPSNEINKSATQRVANIGIFLSQSLLGSLGADAAEADRLSFATGEKISRQGKETYDIEYKLSDRWTLTGEYNEYDEYNAGLKWRVFRGKRAGDSDEDAKK